MKDYHKYIILDTASIRDSLIALNNLSNDVLTLFVVDKNECMVGTLTDGDIRRKLIEGYSLNDRVATAMQRSFHYFEYNSGNMMMELQKVRDTNITLMPCLDTVRHIIRVYNFRKQLSILPIDAIIMAGGKGERLRPLTEKTPNPLLKVGDKSIIDYNIDRLILYGVEHISVTVNYLKEQIEEHFKDFREGVRVDCVREPNFLGTIGSVKYVDSFQNDTVLVMNSDLFTNINFEDFYMHFIENNADMSIAAVPYAVNVPYGIFDLDGKEIQGIKEKPTYNYYANAGIYLIKKELLELIPENTFYNATDFMELLISRNHKVIRFPLTGYWIDIGNHEDYKKAIEMSKHI